MPPPSLILYGFGFGLALRMRMSVNAMTVSPRPATRRHTRIYRRRYRQILRLQENQDERLWMKALKKTLVSQRYLNTCGRVRTDANESMAGAPGFEPGNGGIKIRCLTTWLRPNAAADHTGAPAPDQRSLAAVGGSRYIPAG
jgi:hypothetical protein